MNYAQFKKMLNEHRAEFMLQTGGELTIFCDSKFQLWLKEIDIVGKLEAKGLPLVRRDRGLARSIYMSKARNNCEYFLNVTHRGL